MRPGGYKKVFNMNQNDLFNDILGVLEETYNAYKSSKLTQDNQPDNDNKKDEYYGFKEKNRLFKNINDVFIEPQKITSSIFILQSIVEKPLKKVIIINKSQN